MLTLYVKNDAHGTCFKYITHHVYNTHGATIKTIIIVSLPPHG